MAGEDLDPPHPSLHTCSVGLHLHPATKGLARSKTSLFLVVLQTCLLGGLPLLPIEPTHSLRPCSEVLNDTWLLLVLWQMQRHPYICGHTWEEKAEAVAKGVWATSLPSPVIQEVHPLYHQDRLGEQIALFYRWGSILQVGTPRLRRVTSPEHGSTVSKWERLN